MTDYAQALDVAVAAAREAGQLLREEFHRPGGPRGSGGHAEIDQQAEEAIQKKLLAAFPWSYLGEETGQISNQGPHLWLVDPNDGTSAYLKGWRGSAVSIAALRDGVPVLGVVFAFGYPDDDGDLIAWTEGCPLTRNGQPVGTKLAAVVLDGEANPPQVVFISQDGDKNSAANAECVRPARVITMPSIAYRLALVAAGEGVAATSLNGPCGWDYAAGHALVQAAGGILADEKGNEVKYSPQGHSSTRYCFGGAPAVVKELCKRDWKKVFTPSTAPAPPFCLVRPVRGRAVSDAKMLSRAQGCLLGQLTGDSLGSLVEFSSPAKIKASYPNGVRDLKDGGTWGNMAGQPTDDSEMSLMLARTLVHEGRYDSGLVLNSYAHWWRDHAWDHGNTLGQALEPACSGKTTTERLQLAKEHASQSSQSNGCLMRISPLAIFGANTPSEAADWAREDCRLTHPNPVCQETCAVFVAAIATTISTACGKEACYEAALAEADRSNVAPSVRQALEDARKAPPADYVTQMGWVLIALQNAFYQLLHATSFEEGVVDTVMRGGDTDTTAAIAGALLGAVHGRQAVPSRWLRAALSCRPLPPKVPGHNQHPQPMEFWPVDALELAEALLLARKVA